jgi:5-oxoprolinase (ATP-hydrolysing)
VVRQIEFLHPMTLSLLSERRGQHPPYGMAGGNPGAIGKNRLIRADGSNVELDGIAQLDVAAGDILVVETPGGGGFGKPT